MTMTGEEIQNVIDSLEDGDEVIVTSGEGYYEVVTRGRVKVDNYFGCSMGVFNLYKLSITSIQVVSKGTPKWHRAKVISAELKGTKEPQYFVRDVEDDDTPWADARTIAHAHDELENVVIIVGEDG